MVELPPTFDPEKLARQFTELQWGAGTWYALATCSALAEHLTLAILCKMDNPSKTLCDEIFGADRPIGSFSSRISLARALGVIDTRTYSELNELRKIRNDLAHSHEFLHFDHPDIRKKFNLIKPVQNNNHPYLNGYLEAADRIMVILKEFRQNASRAHLRKGRGR